MIIFSLCLVLSQEENSFGHFLRNHGELDKTCAGKMMNAVGKAMIYSAQQRASLRSPLTRLHQVSVFHLICKKFHFHLCLWFRRLKLFAKEQSKILLTRSTKWKSAVMIIEER